MGAVFGGGASSTVFGSCGAGNFLTMLTKICAAVFMLTSLSLSYLYTQQAGESLFEDGIEAVPEEPFEQVGTVVPEEANPQTDVIELVEPLDASGDGAASAAPAGGDAGAADESP